MIFLIFIKEGRALYLGLSSLGMSLSIIINDEWLLIYGLSRSLNKVMSIGILGWHLLREIYNTLMRAMMTLRSHCLGCFLGRNELSVLRNPLV